MKKTANNRVRIVASGLALILATALVLNTETSIRQGVNGRVREIHMPLYVKGIEFLARHLEYGRLAKEITAGCGSDEQKVLAILKWTRENIRDVPPGMPVFDDHILNIIIRGYGVQEQFQDVFTTICSYAGIPAYWGRVRGDESNAKYTLSFVDIGGRRLVFDAYYGIYFRNRSGEIASVRDILSDRSIVSGQGVEAITIKGAPYNTFYYHLDNIGDQMSFRPQKQMPLQRIIYEIRNIARNK